MVLGPNGAGKTTLLRVLATLLRPHAGEVRVLGDALPGEAWAVRGRIGLLGHEPLLYRELSARENLRFHARLHGVGFERVEELLGAVGMAARAEEPVRTLSRGMVQRVAIARARAARPGAAAARRAAREPRPRGGGARGAADRACLGPDARGVQPRSRRPTWRARTSCSACARAAPRCWRAPSAVDAAGDRGAVRVSAVTGGAPETRASGAPPVAATPPAGDAERAVRRRRSQPATHRPPPPGFARTVAALLRKELLVELRTLESVPGMSLFAVTVFVIFHFALNRDRRQRRRGRRDPVGDAAARRDAGDQPAVRRRRRGGRLRRLPAGAGGSLRAARGEGARAARLPGRAGAGGGARVRAAAARTLARAGAAGPARACCCWAIVGIALIGTLVAALAVRTRARDLLGPLLALPLLVPVVIGGARATAPLLTLSPSIGRPPTRAALAADARAL